MNKIDLIVKYSTDAFDEVYKADSRASLLDGNKKLMQFTGAKTVKIAKFAFTGLYDYKRANGEAEGRFSNGAHTGTSGYGYQQGDMEMTWEEFTIGCDRACQYRVEMFDNEETAQMAVGMGTTQINKQVIIPEIDAYCFSKIVERGTSVAMGNLVTSALTEGNAFKDLNDALVWFDDNEVPAEDQIIFVSPSYYNALRNTGGTNGIVKPLLQSDLTKDVKFSVEEYEGRKIIVVPGNRFQTALTFGAGYWGPSADSKKIDFLVCAKSAIYHVVKYNKIRVFGPEVVQDYDGYKVNARVYHDVFIPDNKKVAVYAHVASGNTGVATKVLVDAVAGEESGETIIKGATTLPGGIMFSEIYACTADHAVGTAITAGSGVVAVTLGTPFTKGSTTHVVLAHNGKVVASSAITLPVGA